MRYELRTSRRVAKEIAALPRPLRERLTSRMERLEDWPDHGQDVAPLRGDLAGCYRLRCGQYRVLFRVLEDERIVVVEKVASRGSVYD